MRLLIAVIRRRAVVTLVGLGLLVTVLAAGVAPALAAPGPISGLSSATHPDEASWYADPNPSLTWQATLGVAGYAYLIDQTPGTIPPTTVTSPGLRFSRTTLTAGLQPWSIVSGDLNGDGKADLVVANYAANTVSVLLGNGNGSFQTRVDYATGANPHGVALADLNGDGTTDVLVATWSDARVGVLLGNGNGSLRPAVAYAVGSHPSQIASGDFNGDGNLDLAVANYSSNTVSVLLGNGNGTLRAATSYPTGANAEDLAAADLNDDGRLDLAVVVWTANSVNVLLGNGDGSFGLKVDYSVGAHPHAIVATDLDGDGTFDLAVANWNDKTLSVLAGRGDGTFAAATSYPVGSVPAQVVVADLNGDDIPDLAVADRLDANAGVLLGKGDGSFTAFRTFAVPAYPHAIVAGDFNGDGLPDIAVACNATAGTSVGVLLNTTMTPLTAAYSHLSDGVWYFHVCAIDTAGAAGPTATRAVAIDTTAPVTTDDADPGGLATWHAGPWTMTLSPSDPRARDGSHSGLVGGAADTQYSTDGGVTWQSGTAVAFPRWKRGGGSGLYGVLYRSRDAAGNLEGIESATVRIDNSLPVSAATLSTAGDPATVTLTAADPDSGVASIWYALDHGAWTQVSYPRSGGVAVSITGPGTHTLRYYAVDNAGNLQAGYQVATVTIAAPGGPPASSLARHHREPHKRHGAASEAA